MTEPLPQPPAADAAAALQALPWLARANARARAALLREASLRRYERHEPLFLRGDAIEQLWVVVQGAVELGVVEADGRRFVAALVPPGEAIGFIPLLDGRGAIHDARATEPTCMLRIPKAAFLDALQADRELLQAVLLLILVRSRRLNEWRAEALVRPLGARLARLLQGMSRAGDVPSLELKITQDDLAAMLGVTRQALSPEIKAMERKGLLALGYKRVLLRDLAGLMQMAEGPAS